MCIRDSMWTSYAEMYARMRLGCDVFGAKFAGELNDGGDSSGRRGTCGLVSQIAGPVSTDFVDQSNSSDYLTSLRDDVIRELAKYSAIKQFMILGGVAPIGSWNNMIGDASRFNSGGWNLGGMNAENFVNFNFANFAVDNYMFSVKEVMGLSKESHLGVAATYNNRLLGFPMSTFVNPETDEVSSALRFFYQQGREMIAKYHGLMSNNGINGTDTRALEVLSECGSALQGSRSSFILG